MVFLEGADGSFGSGVSIFPTEIITAAHAVGNNATMTAHFIGYGAVEAKVTGYDRARDVALLTHAPRLGIADVVWLDLARNRIGLHPITNEAYDQWGAGTEVALVGYVPAVFTSRPVITYGRLA